jgi:hypothetical protein
VWGSSETEFSFWPVKENQGVRRLREIVQSRWGGGRLLFLPTGHVIKPLQADIEVGKRVVVGRFEGEMVLTDSDGRDFNLENPGLTPGDRWPAPHTMGLETVLESDGSLRCDWSHPSPTGREVVNATLCKGPAALIDVFRRYRPGDQAGRVHLMPYGHVVTNHVQRDGSWRSSYIGFIEPLTLGDWNRWIGGTEHAGSLPGSMAAERQQARKVRDSLQGQRLEGHRTPRPGG